MVTFRKAVLMKTVDFKDFLEQLKKMEISPLDLEPDVLAHAGRLALLKDAMNEEGDIVKMEDTFFIVVKTEAMQDGQRVTLKKAIMDMDISIDNKVERIIYQGILEREKVQGYLPVAHKVKIIHSIL